MVIYLIVAAIAYLLGSIPFGYILLRVFRGEDVRQHGSGNIGATNVARKAPALGIATLLLDAAKGYGAVISAAAIGRFASVDADYTRIPLLMAVAALFSILGHLFPVWLRFKGGKGVATGVGSFLALAPKAVLVVLIVFAAVVALFRYVSLGSIIATAGFPVAAFLIYRTWGLVPHVIALASAALIILKHHQNIRRLLAGTEHRFELKHR